MSAARCPETGMACATAYRKRGCRCTSCKAHSASAECKRLLNRRLEALEAEFIEAVRTDWHYLEDFALTYHRHATESGRNAHDRGEGS